MREWFYELACVVGLAACGYPHLPELGGTASDAASSDAPIGDAGPPRQFLSCAELAMICGVNGSASCCESLEVPSGSYDRSHDLVGDGDSGDTNAPATVSSFRLDKYEVTVGRFRAFVNAGMGTQASHPAPGAGAHAKIMGSGWDGTWNANLAMNTMALVAAVKCDSTYQTWTDIPAANEHRPMNCLTWYEAMAFCAWDGGYLPTEAEWNYAAAGGDQQRAYPWSTPAGSLTPLDGSHASYEEGTTCVGDGSAGCAWTDLVAVGTKPLGDGRWGQSDLAGNVFEWALDWYAGYATPCTDCADLLPASYRAVRGGSFDRGAVSLRAGNRIAGIPAARYDNVGVRCAR